jgi:hypothetical protein
MKNKKKFHLIKMLLVTFICSDQGQPAIKCHRYCKNIIGCDNWSISQTSGGNYQYNNVWTKGMPADIFNGLGFHLQVMQQ